jgi:hypothetical protein
MTYIPQQQRVAICRSVRERHLDGLVGLLDGRVDQQHPAVR